MTPNVVWLQKWRPAFAGKHMTTFFGGHTKKRSSWSLWQKICHTKFSHQNFLGKSGNIRAKILRTPKSLPVPTPMSGGTTPRCAVAFGGGCNYENTTVLQNATPKTVMRSHCALLNQWFTVVKTKSCYTPIKPTCSQECSESFSSEGFFKSIHNALGTRRVWMHENDRVIPHVLQNLPEATCIKSQNIIWDKCLPTHRATSNCYEVLKWFSFPDMEKQTYKQTPQCNAWHRKCCRFVSGLAADGTTRCFAVNTVQWLIIFMWSKTPPAISQICSVWNWRCD